MSDGDPGHAGPLPESRIHGLDAWRAILMLVGLLVHSSLMLPSRPVFTIVGDLSQAFRMGTFFAISGYLASIVLLRRDAIVWLRRRLHALGVPLLFGMAVVSPLIWIVARHGGPHPDRPDLLPFEWHHLWFLAGLMLYSAVAVAFHRSDAALKIIDRVDRLADRANGRTTIMAVALACALLIGAMMPVLYCLSTTMVRAFGNAQWIMGYVPMFAFGLVLARADRLRMCVLRARLFCLVIVLAAIAAYAASHRGEALDGVAGEVRFIMACLCPPAAFVLILGSALSIRRVPRVFRHLADASFTIYVVHYPISVVLNTHVLTGVEPHLAYFLNVMATAAASVAVHFAGTRHVPLLAFLLNGKPLEWPLAFRVRSGDPRPTTMEPAATPLSVPTAAEPRAVLHPPS